MKTEQTHERLGTLKDDTKPPSERRFGITFGILFILFAFLPLLHGGSMRWWSAEVGAVFLVLAYLAESVLQPFNMLWFRLGLALHRIVNPLILGAMFFLAITPLAIVMRGLGKKLLSLDRDPQTTSYWITRRPPGPSADSVRRQF